MTKRIAFIGPAGSGKSTLTLDVTSALKKRHINAELITEWIRTDINLHGPMKNIWEQYRTLENQRRIEDSVPDAVDYIITDSGTLTPYFYACLYADNNDARQRLVLADMYKHLLDDLYLRRYDFIFLLDKEETYKANKNILNDGTRYQTQDDINQLDDHMLITFTRLHKLDNIIHLTGPLDERCRSVIDVLFGGATQIVHDTQTK